MNDRSYYPGSKRSMPPVVMVLFMAIGLVAIFILPVLLLDKYINNNQGPENDSKPFLYADPTRDIELTRNAPQGQPTPDTSWKTPVPDGYFLTPGNLDIALSGTPYQAISQASEQVSRIQQEQATFTNTPRPTETPTSTITPTPTSTFTPTMNPAFLTATQDIINAQVQLEIEKLANAAERQEEISNLKKTFVAFIATIFCFSITGIAFWRVFKEYKLYRQAMSNQKRLDEIAAQPWLVYPASIQYEAEWVYKLTESVIAYCVKEQIDPREQTKIPRFSDLEGFGTNEWIDTTNYLVNRGYIIKQQGKSTLLKRGNVLQLKMVVEQGLYLERNPYEKLVEQSPS